MVIHFKELLDGFHLFSKHRKDFLFLELIKFRIFTAIFKLTPNACILGFGMVIVRRSDFLHAFHMCLLKDFSAHRG